MTVESETPRRSKQSTMETINLQSLSFKCDPKSKFVLFKPSTKPNWKEPANRPYLKKKNHLAQMYNVALPELAFFASTVNDKHENQVPQDFFWCHPRLASFILAPRDDDCTNQIEDWTLELAAKGHDFGTMFSMDDEDNWDVIDLILHMDDLELNGSAIPVVASTSKKRRAEDIDDIIE